MATGADPIPGSGRAGQSVEAFRGHEVLPRLGTNRELRPSETAYVARTRDRRLLRFAKAVPPRSSARTEPIGSPRICHPSGGDERPSPWLALARTAPPAPGVTALERSGRGGCHHQGMVSCSIRTTHLTQWSRVGRAPPAAAAPRAPGRADVPPTSVASNSLSVSGRRRTYPVALITVTVPVVPGGQQPGDQRPRTRSARSTSRPCSRAPRSPVAVASHVRHRPGPFGVLDGDHQPGIGIDLGNRVEQPGRRGDTVGRSGRPLVGTGAAAGCPRQACRGGDALNRQVAAERADAEQAAAEEGPTADIGCPRPDPARRRRTCSAAGISMASPTPTCTSSTPYPPMSTSRPVLCARPVSRATTTRTASRIDVARPGRRCRRPRRAIIDFHGSSRRIANPTAACRPTTNPTGPLPTRKAPNPVTTASGSVTSSPMLVRRPATPDGTACRTYRGRSAIGLRSTRHGPRHERVPAVWSIDQDG